MQTSTESIGSKLFSFFSEFLESFFYPFSDKKYEGLRFFWLFLLYVSGVYLWGKAFDWGRMPVDYFDWALINTPRIDFVRDALRNSVLPLHMADLAPLHYISDRFFTLPDVVTTPQMILLLFVSIQKFVFFDILLHYTLSFLGLLWFYRRFSFSIFTFTVLLFLYGFNGYIFAHYSVGHFTWAAYFLFPIFFMLVICFLEGEEGWKWVTKMAFLLFYMILAGSQHHYVWLLLFLGILSITCWQRAKWIFRAIISSGLLSAVRLLPPALQLADYQKKGIFNAVFGYPSVSHMFESMLFIKLPHVSPVDYYTLDVYHENFWDFNFFIGAVGFSFLLYFSLYLWLRDASPLWKQMILPAFALVALSIETTYWIVRATGIPLFASERATMRILGVPMVWLFLIGAITFQEWWNKQKRDLNRQIIALILLGFMLIDLLSNLRAWNPSNIRNYFVPVEMNIESYSIANHSDPQYFLVLGIGTGLTAVTAIFLFFMTRRETKMMVENNA